MEAYSCIMLIMLVGGGESCHKYLVADFPYLTMNNETGSSSHVHYGIKLSGLSHMAAAKNLCKCSLAS